MQGAQGLFGCPWQIEWKLALIVAPAAPAEPPEPIEELPPEYRPDGDNVRWIPGYWAWDDERQDFLWISGLWREVDRPEDIERWTRDHRERPWPRALP